MDAKALSLRLETAPEDTGPPEELGDVLDPPGRDAHEVQLDNGLLDRGLAPTVALGPDELRRLLVEQRVERLLDRLPHQIIYALVQRLLVDRYDVRRNGPRLLRHWFVV